MSDPVRWMLLGAPSLLLINWTVVLLGVAALAWQRREGRWPAWHALVHLAAAIARDPRYRARTLLLAARLLILDLLAPLAFLLVR